MKKIYKSFLVSALAFTGLTQAQDVQWMTSTPINYNLNPEMPVQPACASANRIYTARMVDYSLDYGSDIFGSMAIDCYDPSGTLMWTYPLGDSVTIKCITSDASGNVFIGGEYMETLHMGTNDSLENTDSGLNINLVLFSLDVTGNLTWKRNVSLAHPVAQEISAIGMDHLSSCWYELSYFDSAKIIRLDPNGMETQSYLITGIRTLSSFSFDPMGNLYLTGSSGLMNITIGNFSMFVPESYMMFFSRIDAAGNCNWIRLAYDVTFQSPQIVAADNGDAYVAGTLMDSTSLGAVVFDGVEWVYDIFLAKVDSSGNFSWGVEVPHQPTLTGDFQRGKNNFMDVDSAGNVYMAGTIRGRVDWGNGVISDAGPIPSIGISILSFDSSGTARWHISGGAMGFITPYSLIVSGVDECYFANSVVGELTLDSITTNQGGNYAFVLGKISTAVTGIYSPDMKNDFVIYPNPVDKFLSYGPLNPNAATSADAEISISNIVGEEIMKITPLTLRVNSVGQVDVSTLPPGIYFLSAGDVKKKFVVQAP